MSSEMSAPLRLGTHHWRRVLVAPTLMLLAGLGLAPKAGDTFIGAPGVNGRHVNLLHSPSPHRTSRSSGEGEGSWSS